MENVRHLTSERPPGSAELSSSSGALPFLRLDDFPGGNPYRGGHSIEEVHRAAREVLGLLAGTCYILGASLLSCSPEDITVLNECVSAPGMATF